MASKTWHAAAALSLNARLLITSKSTATQANTQGGEGEGRGEEGGKEGPASKRNAKNLSKNENQIVHVSDYGKF